MASTAVRPSPSKRRKAAASKPSPSHGLLVVGDLLMTGFWVFLSSVFAEVREACCQPPWQAASSLILTQCAAMPTSGPACCLQVAEALAAVSGLQEFGLAVVVTILAVMAVGPLCDAFGGALVNPTHNLAFMAAGKSSIIVNTMRMVAQIVGALAGSYAAVHLLPPWLQE